MKGKTAKFATVQIDEHKKSCHGTVKLFGWHYIAAASVRYTGAWQKVLKCDPSNNTLIECYWGIITQWNLLYHKILMKVKIK